MSKRYVVQSLLRTTQQPLQLGAFDTPAEALKTARRFEKEGMSNIEINDMQQMLALPLKDFARQNGG